jgi:hypothetical protein
MKECLRKLNGKDLKLTEILSLILVESIPLCLKYIVFNEPSDTTISYMSTNSSTYSYKRTTCFSLK